MSDLRVESIALTNLIQIKPAGAGGGETVATGDNTLRATPGQIVQGTIFGLDGQGEPLLKSEQGNLSLKLPFHLPSGVDVVLRMEQSSAGLRARILSIDGMSLKEYAAKLTAPTPSNTAAPLPNYAAPPRSLPAQPTAADILLSESILADDTQAATSTQATALPLTRPPLPTGVIEAELLSRGARLPELLAALPQDQQGPPRLKPGALVQLKLLNADAPTTPLPTTTPLPAQPASYGQLIERLHVLQQAQPNIAAGQAAIPGTAEEAPPASSAPPASTPASPATPPTVASTSQASAAQPPALVATTAAQTAAPLPTPEALSTAPTTTPTMPGAAAVPPQAPSMPAPTAQIPPSQVLSPPPAAQRTTTPTAPALSTPALASASALPLAPPSATPTVPANEAVPALPAAPAASPAPAPAAPSAPALEPARLPGRVIEAEPTGEKLLHTPIGVLRLPVAASRSLVEGSRVEWSWMGAHSPDVAFIPNAEPQSGNRLLLLAKAWPRLDALLSLTTSEHDIAATTSEVAIALGAPPPPAMANMPQPGPKMGAALLFLVAALRKGDVMPWIGRGSVEQLLSKQRGDILKGLESDFAVMQRALIDPPSTQWQALLFPVWVDGQLEHARLFVNRHTKDEQDSASPVERNAQGVRFVLELSLSELGDMQLCGLVQKQAAAPHFDLIVRSHQPLAEPLKQGIRDIFQQGAELTGYRGELLFQTMPSFPDTPLESFASPSERTVVA